jgi:acyl carrier protein phosphodiesterase
MNFLAHFYLAFNDNQLLTGQFAGDHVRGRQLDHFPERIANGIRLHRFIDNCTDNYETNKELRQRIRPYFGLWSPVAIDLYYDHFLALKWQNYHNTDLQLFAHNCYTTLQGQNLWLNEEAKQVLFYMEKHNWLGSYHTTEGIGRAFQGLSRRVVRGDVLSLGPAVLEEHGAYIEECFDNFFPQLIGETKNKLITFASV